MVHDILYFKDDITQEDLKIIRGCLLTTKETLRVLPFKNNYMKNKIKQIDVVLAKFSEGGA